MPTGAEPRGALAAHMDALVIATGKTEALAAVAMEWFDGVTWGHTDQLQTDRLAHMLGATAQAAAGAVGMLNRFRTWFADQQPAEAGDDWER